MKNADNDQPVTLGTYIREARERAHLTLRNVEHITGIARSKLFKLEADRIEKPDVRALGILANSLELNVSDLLAFLGVTPSAELPSLTPYLRAKYKLPPEAAAEADARLRDLLERYGSGDEGSDFEE